MKISKRNYFYLEGDEESDGLDAVVASVHVVSHEQVVGVGGLASDPEQLHQVMELSVNVSADCYWTFYLQICSSALSQIIWIIRIKCFKW